MQKHDIPPIKSVDIEKEGRFWSIKTDGKLLALVLYKQGAVAIQTLLQRLAGLPVTAELEAEGSKPKPPGKNSEKPAAKPKAAITKPQIPHKKQELETPKTEAPVQAMAAVV